MKKTLLRFLGKLSENDFWSHAFANFGRYLTFRSYKKYVLNLGKLIMWTKIGYVGLYVSMFTFFLNKAML